MPTYVVNGTSYAWPEINEEDWGTVVNAWASAVSTSTLQKTGGSFTLTAEVDFGATYGLKAAYFKSRTSNTAASGPVRLANNEGVAWRNAGNSADLTLKVNASNELEFNGSALGTAGALTTHEADTSTHGVSGAIVGTTDTQTLTNKTIDADSNTITNIENADIKAGAAIAHNKMAALTASRAMVTDGSGVASTSSVTATELGYVSGVTSALQTQLDAKAAASALTSHESDTSTHGVSVAIVGTTETQTLTNKTLTAPIIDDYLDLNEESAPSTPSSGKVRVYAKTDKKLYLKNSDGTESAVGSGAGEKNYITGSSTATGWTAVGDLAVATSTTAAELPREYTTGSGIKITADADTQSTADYVYHDFTLDDVDLNKKLKIQWSQKTTGTYNAGDLAVIITSQADRTTALHTPVTTAIPSADGVFTTSFDSSSTATLSLVVRATTDMTTNGGIVISDVVVGPGTQPQGAVVGEWQTYTPDFGSFPETSATARWRRVGDSMEVYIQAVASGAVTGIISLPLPSGYTIDTTKLVGTDQNLGMLGMAQAADGSAAYYVANVTYNSTTSVRIINPGTGATADYWKATVPFTWGSGDTLTARFTVPIAEWAGSGTLNVAQNDVEYASNSGTWDASDTTSFTYGPAGQVTGGALTAIRNKRVRFQSPIQAGDKLELEFSTNRTLWLPAQGFSDGAGTVIVPSYNTAGSGGSSAGVFLAPVSGSSTDVDVSFFRYANIANDDSPVTEWPSTWYWRVKKTAAGVAVGFGAATSTASGLYKAGQAPGQTTGTTIAAGYLGEIKDSGSIGSGINVNAATALGSLTLTAGHWLLMATAQYSGAAGNAYYEACINNSSASFASTTLGKDRGIGMVISASGVGSNIYLSVNVSVSSSTTYYLNCQTPSAAATNGGILGRLLAVRIA